MTTAQVFSGIFAAICIWSLVDLAIKYTRKRQHIQLGVTAVVMVFFAWALTVVPVATMLEQLNADTSASLDQLSTATASRLQHSKLFSTLSADTALAVLSVAVLMFAVFLIVFGLKILKARLKASSHFDIWK